MRKIFCPLVVSLFLLLMVKPVMAVEPMMKLVPSSGTYTKDTAFDVVVAVDSGIVETMAIDVHLKYDPSKVEIQSALPVANLFDTLGLVSIGPTDDSASGKFFDSYYISLEKHPSEKAVVAGNLLNIKFKPKIAGTINIDFNCTTGSSADSNIFNAVTTADVISCPSNINGVYTITDGGTANPDPTAVPTASPTANNELPKTGTVETTISLLIFGFVSLLSSLALKFL